VQTALLDQADRPNPNDARTAAPSQRPSGSLYNIFAEQQGSCSSLRDDVILDKANGVMDNVAALWLKHDLQSLAHVQARDIAQLLTALCLDDTVDLTWMQRTKRAWKMAVRRSIQQQNAHIAAKSASSLTNGHSIQRQQDSPSRLNIKDTQLYNKTNLASMLSKWHPSSTTAFTCWVESGNGQFENSHIGEVTQCLMRYRSDKYVIMPAASRGACCILRCLLDCQLQLSQHAVLSARVNQGLQSQHAAIKGCAMLK